MGEIRHRKEHHPGQHEAIVDRELWGQVQRLLCNRAAHSRGQTTNAVSHLLAGKLFDEAGEPLYVCGAAKGRRRYRYYVSRKLVRGTADEVHDGWRLAAPQIERSVALAACRVLKDQAAIAESLHQAGASPAEIDAARRAAKLEARRSRTLPTQRRTLQQVSSSESSSARAALSSR